MGLVMPPVITYCLKKMYLEFNISLNENISGFNLSCNPLTLQHDTELN